MEGYSARCACDKTGNSLAAERGSAREDQRTESDGRVLRPSISKPAVRL